MTYDAESGEQDGWDPGASRSDERSHATNSHPRRDYAFEALSDVTNTNWDVGRGELNKALQQIREQADIEDSFLLSAEIHERAKMYRALWPEISLTPSALAKHWVRVFEESHKLRRASLPPPPPLPQSRPQENLASVRELMSTLWGREGEDEVLRGDHGTGLEATPATRDQEQS